MSIRERLLDFIFPPRCYVCGEVLKSGEIFCEACAHYIMENKSAKFTNSHDFAFSQAVFTADYSDVTQPAIVRLKRFKDATETEVFAKLLAFTIIKELDNAEFDCVVAVPMSEAKMKARGHNQAETLAQKVAIELSIPYVGGLLLQKDYSSAQHTLGREEREISARERYASAPGAEISGRVLLVDDVITTGATLNRCAELLRELGAYSVVVAAALSTPKKNKSSEGKE